MGVSEDLVTTTLEHRAKPLADTVSKSNAFLMYLTKSGNNKKYSGGTEIREAFAHAENATFGYYQGSETIDVSLNQTLGYAQYQMKMAAGSVVITGEEQLKNSSKEAAFDLIEERIMVAEATLKNLISTGVYSDGTGSGGKQIGGLQLIVADAPTSGTVGGIDRSIAGNAFWRNKVVSGTTVTAANIVARLNALYVQLLRGDDKPDIGVMDNNFWTLYHDALAPIQRINTEAGGKLAGAGFPALQYMGINMILDGGDGGACPTNHAYLLNSKYFFFKTHKDRNFVVINGDRQAVNQDAMVKLMGWAGNVTCSAPKFQGVLIN